MNQFRHIALTSCPHCLSDDFQSRAKTALGYESYICQDCRRVFNERTSTVFNHLEYPADIVMLAVRWYISYKLIYRDIADMSAETGFDFTHETVHDWVQRFVPLLTEKFRQKRKFKAGESFYVDETYIKI